MARRSRSAVLRGVAGFLASAILLSVPTAPVSAAGLFESIFGGLSRTFDDAPQPQARAYAEPLGSQPVIRRERISEGGSAGPRHAFCVRTCDGRYFPVHPHAGLSAAQACHSFCPACQTRLYYGATIDYAVASNGSRYADLPNTYLYRKQLVADCSCNGRSTMGLAEIIPKSDPTLRRGDIVATPTGLVAYRGGRDQAKNFTPVKSYDGFSGSERAKLSALQVTPPDQRGTAETPVMPPHSAASGMSDNRTAQK